MKPTKPSKRAKRTKKLAVVTKTVNFDQTFCASKVHKPECDRRITPEVLKAAKADKREYFWQAYLCDEPEPLGA
jgi:hypothetical protein